MELTAEIHRFGKFTRHIVRCGGGFIPGRAGTPVPHNQGNQDGGAPGVSPGVVDSQSKPWAFGASCCGSKHKGRGPTGFPEG